jgi:DivIVA domain-containing protein
LLVDEDNPEKRISELERQLADQKPTAQPEHIDQRPLTPEDIHNLAFSNPARGRRGYHEDEVDAFLDRVEATLRDPTARGGVTSADIHNVSFSKPQIGRRGYNEDEVDAFLGRVAIELAGRAGQRPAVGPVQAAPQNFGAATGPGPRHLRPSDESTARKILDHILAFLYEFGTNHGRVTWRAPLVIGRCSSSSGSLSTLLTSWSPLAS